MNEILPGLHLGDYADAIVDAATNPKRLALCVLEALPPDAPPRTMHVKILSYDVSGATPRVFANPRQLDAAAMIIDSALAKDERNAGPGILVHCAAGVERSPLTVVWYLMHYEGMTMDGAYEFVRTRRPIVEDRRIWLPDRY